jgi:methionyl-tRNA formyltransferase
VVKLVFCGTPRFAVPSLEALHAAGHAISLVVSQPDRPSGRKQEIQPTPVKQAALNLALLVTQPEKIRNNAEFRSQLETIQPDVIIVVAYGRIIPPWMLALPKFGCINLHASLLPKYRGAAPIQWAVAMGETVTGNTTMLLEEGLDTGPVLLQQGVKIGAKETAAELFESLAVCGAPLLAETLEGLAAGRIQPKPQDHALATLAPILQREDGHMNFGRSATELYNRWRGFQPWPGAFAYLDGRKITFTRLQVAAPHSHELAAGEPGELRHALGGLFLACAEGTWLDVQELQPEGKRSMAATEFLRGARLASATRLS